MNDPKTLDQMTSDDLDHLHHQLDAARRMLSPDNLRLIDEMVATVEQEKDRAARAEATVARVRKACASVQAADQGHNPAVGWVVMRVLEAIDARLVNGAAPALASPCAGFPDQCPNPQPVPALSPYHGGGIRCGCTTPKEN